MKTFGEHVAAAMEQLKISDVEVANEFDVSLPTVVRWRSGVNAPHALFQVPVLEWFKKKGYKEE